MTEQTKPQQIKANLPCQWVEEEGFEVTPNKGQTKSLPVLTDTAFLLKSAPLPRPTQSSNS